MKKHFLQKLLPIHFADSATDATLKGFIFDTDTQTVKPISIPEIESNDEHKQQQNDELCQIYSENLCTSAIDEYEKLFFGDESTMLVESDCIDISDANTN